MKSKAIALLAMMLLLTVGVASAQSTEPMVFRSPFPFIVGDQLMPAGEYKIQIPSPTGLLSFRSRADGNVNAFVNSAPVEKLETESNYKVIFHRYGDRYYVSEIWVPGFRTGRTVLQLAGEQDLAKKSGEPQHVTLYVEPL